MPTSSPSRPSRRTPRLTPRARQMRGLLAEQEASGLSVRAFAAARGLKESQLWNWRRRLRESGLAPVAPSPDPFLPVAVIPDPAPPSASSFELALPGGLRIQVAHGFDAVELRRLIRTIGSC